MLQRYYFDVDDGRRRVHDQVGKELISQHAVVAETDDLLRTLLGIRELEASPGITYVRVRNADGRPIHEGSIELRG